MLHSWNINQYLRFIKYKNYHKDDQKIALLSKSSLAYLLLQTWDLVISVISESHKSDNLFSQRIFLPISEVIF
jgi:hypothetical protein